MSRVSNPRNKKPIAREYQNILGPRFWNRGHGTWAKRELGWSPDMTRMDLIGSGSEAAKGLKLSIFC